MPIQTEVRSNGSVIVFNVTDPIRLEEVVEQMRDVEPYFDQSSDIVHTVINLVRVRQLPLGIIGTRSYAGYSHPNAGKIIIVGADTLVRTLANVIVKLTNNHNIAFFETEQQAWDHLEAQKSTELS